MATAGCLKYPSERSGGSIPSRITNIAYVFDIYLCMPSSISDTDFIDAVKLSFSIREALIKLNLAPYGGNYKSFNLRVKRLNLDISHFLGQGHLKNKNHNWSKKIPLEELLVKNSNRIFRESFKKRLIESNLIEHKCSCGLTDSWQGKSIVLHIDHINGDHFDHRIENLRFLCPNCHSQTITYCSKNNGIKRSKIIKTICTKITKKICGECQDILKNSRYNFCKKCYNTNRKKIQKQYKRKTKINWLPINILLEKLKIMNYVQLAQELSISDNAIRKHIKSHSE